MRYPTILKIAAFGFILVSCDSPKKTTNTNPPADNTQVAVAMPNDSLLVDLTALKDSGAFKQTEAIRVAADPVFMAAKNFKAVPLRAFLEQYTSVKNMDVAQTQLIFECEDGYNPSMPLEKIYSRKAYLAVADSDAPKGQDWVNAQKDGHEKVIAPFYVVYTDVAPKEYSFKWPYNLVRMKLVSASEETKAIFPHDDDTMVEGYGLFRVNCSTCHALNAVGGVMGPELNYPKNVTEYWKNNAELKAFIKNPTSYRHGCTMPAQSQLSDAAIDQILKYLTYMKAHKKAAGLGKT